MRRSLIVSLVLSVVASVGLVTVALVQDWRPLLGLDLQGGTEVVLQATEDVSDEELDQAIEVIRNRVDAIGVAEPDITRQGDTVVVQLPGVEDAERARSLVGQTAELRFRTVVFQFDPGDPASRAQAAELVDVLNEVEPETTSTDPADEAAGSTTTAADEAAGSTTTAGDEESSSTTAPATTTAGDEESSSTTAPATTPAGDEESSSTSAPEATTSSAPESTTTSAPATTTTEFDPEAAPSLEELLTPPDENEFDRAVVLLDNTGVIGYVLDAAQATGEVVTSATADFDGVAWSVRIGLTDEGNALLNANVGQTLGVELDSVVYSAATVNQANFSGQAVLTGNFTEDEARDVALVLRFGALPVELEELSARSVSATLGQDALDAGIIAGLVGLLLVGVYMIAYYRLLGVVAMLSLAVSGALLWGLIAWLGEERGLALTLAGVTGIIVSIGVQVDSNVVYYERIKEEVGRGRSLRSAADGGFRSAFSTIVKADVASLIGAGLLYYLSIGSVRGFALFLGVATLLDLVVSFFFMRPAVILLARSRLAEPPSRLGMVTRSAEPVVEVAE